MLDERYDFQHFAIVRFFVRFLSILQSKVFLINTLDVIRTDVFPFLERKIVKDGREILRNVIDIDNVRFEFSRWQCYDKNSILSPIFQLLSFY